MGRLGLVLFVAGSLFALLTMSGCGSNDNTTPRTPVPTIITLSPTTGSLDIGSTLSMTASALDSGKNLVNAPVTFQSSNPAVLTIITVAASGGVAGGLACAGTWDVGGQVCTPGGTGVAEITATSGGITSAPVKVYVHPHIDRIQVVPQPTSVRCLSASPSTPQSMVFQAVASSGGVDISSTVGPFSWTAVNPSVAQLRPQSTNGVLNGMATAIPKNPGVTQIFASIANTTSVPFNFTTCPVQSITLSVRGTGGTTITAAKGASSSIAATVRDTTGNTVSVPLTWTSSNPAIATVSSAGAVASLNPGGTTITASCTPPTCNIGLVPAQPIYAQQPVTATYSGNPASAPSVYATSTGCGATPNCQALIVPVTGSPAALGTGVALPGIPNSFVFNAQGSKAYLGSKTGLMEFDPAANTVAVSPTTIGKVLAVSPKGDKIIASDTQSATNKLFILDTASSTPVGLLIKGATAAAFSPDGLKAFIVASNPSAGPPCTASGSCTLYVYSAQAPLQTIDLADPTLGAPTDVAFLTTGSYGYIARGSGISFLATCDDPGDPANPLPTQVGSVSAPGSLLRALPDGQRLLAWSPPNVSTITAAIGGTPNSALTPPQIIGCPAPYLLTSPPPSDPFGTGFSGAGFLTNTNTAGSPVDLGHGTFTPIAVLVSSDGAKAFILASNLLNVIVYDVASQTTSSLALNGNAAPLAASLSSTGQSLYVTTTDGTLHVVNLVSGGDVQQLDLPSSKMCQLTTGGSVNSCLPDLLAVKP